jgi:hypothetical protein
MSKLEESLIASHKLMQNDGFLTRFVEGLITVAKVQRAKPIYNKYAEEMKKLDKEFEISDFLNKVVASVDFNLLCHNKEYINKVIDLRNIRDKALTEVETKDYNKEFSRAFKIIGEQIPILISQITKILEKTTVINKELMTDTFTIFRTINPSIEMIVGSKINSRVSSESVNIYQSLLSTASWYMFDKLDECNAKKQKEESETVVEEQGTIEGKKRGEREEQGKEEEEEGEGKEAGGEEGIPGETPGENKYLKYKNKYLKYKNKYLKYKKL